MSLDQRDVFFMGVIGTPIILVKHLNAGLLDNNEFLLQTKWIRNNQLPEYESSEFGCKMTGKPTGQSCHIVLSERTRLQLHSVLQGSTVRV